MMIRCRCGSIFGQRWQAGYHHDMLLLLMLLGWRSPRAAALKTQLMEIAFTNAVGRGHIFYLFDGVSRYQRRPDLKDDILCMMQKSTMHEYNLRYACGQGKARERMNERAHRTFLILSMTTSGITFKIHMPDLLR